MTEIKGIAVTLQEALRRQQAVLARRIAEGRSDGRTRRRLLRRERMAERKRKEQEEHNQRRAMVKVQHLRLRWVVVANLSNPNHSHSRCVAASKYTRIT